MGGKGLPPLEIDFEEDVLLRLLQASPEEWLGRSPRLQRLFLLERASQPQERRSFFTFFCLRVRNTSKINYGSRLKSGLGTFSHYYQEGWEKGQFSSFVGKEGDRAIVLTECFHEEVDMNVFGIDYFSYALVHSTQVIAYENLLFKFPLTLFLVLGPATEHIRMLKYNEYLSTHPGIEEKWRRLLWRTFPYELREGMVLRTHGLLFAQQLAKKPYVFYETGDAISA